MLLIVLCSVVVFFLFKKTASTTSLFQSFSQTFSQDQDRLMSQHFQDEGQRNRTELFDLMKQNREELQQSLQILSQSTLKQVTELSSLQQQQWQQFSKQLSVANQSNETRFETLRGTVEKQLAAIQADNQTKLEQMRATVDEKLHATLEKRLGESFKLVSDRLEMVHKGLGDMQTLASGVGDLKKVLTNVKTRGMWGEVQLAQLLEQMLTPDQYDTHVRTKPGSADHVEFAIKFPGREEDPDAFVWLPIDAKFPQDIYQRLVDAQDKADGEAVERESKQLEMALKKEAKLIQSKYVAPPHTTDFAVLFLPTEGLYAEVLRRPGLHDSLQRDFRVMVTGPTTLSALLNSLQMGFRTLAIEKRSSEVWSILAAVKSEFGKFGDILDKTQKKLQEAGNTIENAARKSRTIQRKLRDVEILPGSESALEEAPSLLSDIEMGVSP